MSTEYDIVLSDLHQRSVKSISDAAYTMGDMGLDTGVQYDVFTFDSLTANRALNLPTLADNQGYEFDVINLDGSFNVVITPEGAENINDWNSTFEITEKGGRIRVLGLSGKWLLTPLNDACIYEISSIVADSGLDLTGNWDDVSVDGGANPIELLNGIYGKGLLSAKGIHLVEQASNPAYLYSLFGVGKTAGNNAPDISGAYDYQNGVRTISNTLNRIYATRFIECEYESDGSTIYMKSAIASDELNISTNVMYGIANAPMYIKFIRKY